AMIIGGADDAAAIALLDETISAAPSAAGYLARAQFRPEDDLEGRLSDIAAALEIEPDDLHALDLRANVEMETRDWATAAETLSRVIELAPEEPDYRLRRAEAWLALGDAG